VYEYDEFDVASSVEVRGKIAKKNEGNTTGICVYATAVESKSYRVCSTNITLNNGFIHKP
jgi:hypothetical protein